MLSKLLAITFCTIAASSAMAAESLERAFETTTDAVSLPERAPSTIDARGCLNCKTFRMELPVTARFFVGNDEVTLKELRDYSLGQKINMVILYELEAPVIRRIVVSGTLPNRR